MFSHNDECCDGVAEAVEPGKYIDSETMKQIDFDRVLDSPAHWLEVAEDSRRACEEIDAFRRHPDGCFANLQELDQDILDLWPIYRLLIGLSFENLIKGRE